MKKIAILTSGGDAPGMNAAIRAVTRTAISQGYEVYGIRGGYKGAYDDLIFKLGRKSVSEKLNRGGTFLGSMRFPEFADDEVAKVAYDNLKRKGIDMLIAIGGDGTYKGALKLSRMGMKVMCLPGTIDNDIASSQFTIGFDTAVNTVVDAIDKIRDTSSSHNRCSIIEVMGRHCGDIALHAGIAVGAEAIITHSDHFSYDHVCDIVREGQDNMKKHVLIVITEHICNVIDLAEYVERATNFETRSTILGHIQRGGTPSAYDRFIASSLGAYAIKLCSDGITNVCVGISGTDLYYNDIETALKMDAEDKSIYYEIANQLK